MKRFIHPSLLAGLFFGLNLLAQPALGETTITTLKSPACSCCQHWIDAMRARGFEVTVRLSDGRERARLRERAGFPSTVASCHTSIVDGYLVEGHVPPEALAQLLHERPDIAGIAVPGMPRGAVGMGILPRGAKYDILAIDHQGRTHTVATVYGH